MQKLLIYESLSDYLKPKSEQEIIDALRKETSPSLRLIKAIRYGNKFIVKETLDLLGPNPKLNFSWGYFIETAILHESYEALKLMLSYKHIRNNLTPAHIRKCEKILNQNLQESLSDYVKPKSKEEIKKKIKNLSPQKKLIYGCKYGLFWLVQEALDEGADPSDYNNDSIKVTCEKGYLDIVKLLLEDSRVDPTVDENYPIIWASRGGHIDIVKLLLQYPGVDPSDSDNVAISYTAYEGHTDIVKLLLDDPRVDPSVDNNDPIRSAAFKGHIDIVKLLLKDPRVDPTDGTHSGKNAIEWAIYHNDKDMIKLLLADERVDNKLEYQEEINNIKESLSDYVKPKSKKEIRKSLKNLTPQKKLDIACEYGILWLVEEALDEGANPSYDNNRAIRWASEDGYTDIVKLLLQDPRVDPVVHKNRPIRNASMNGHIDVVKLLLSDSEVYNSLSQEEIQEYERQINNLKESLSDYAKPKSKKELDEITKKLSVDQLVEFGIDYNILSYIQLAIDKGYNIHKNEEYVLRMACVKGHYEMVKYLLDLGCDPSVQSNGCIQWAAQLDNIKVVKLLLKHPDVDPSDDYNLAIAWAYQADNYEIVDILLNDPRVKDTLEQYRIDMYEKCIIKYK